MYIEIKKHEVKLSGSQCVVSSCVSEASLNFYTISHLHIHVLTSIHVCVAGEVCASIQSFFFIALIIRKTLLLNYAPANHRNNDSEETERYKTYFS